MKKTFKLFTSLMLFALLLIPTSSAQAQGPGPDGEGQVVFGSNFTLESDETFEGDLVVFGGNVTIEEDAILNGNLVVTGGTIQSAGEVQGDVVVTGGQVSLEESALVTGDVVLIGSQLDQAEGAEVEGQIINNVAPNITLPTGKIPPTAPEAPVVPEISQPNFSIDFNPFGEVLWVFVRALGLAAFAMLLALFWQPQIERTGEAIISQPLMAGAIGLAATVVGTVLFFTILPLMLVAFAWVFGVVAMGWEAGKRFAKATNQIWSPVLSIGFGTFLLALAGGVIGLVPCLGFVIITLFGFVGVGASVITLFGSRPIQLPALTTYTPPTDSGQDAPVG
jgi:cytoskeletal protein CcmA (bactofilin family)